MIVLNLAFGMSPALVGVVSAIPRLVDAVSDPVMGYILDNTKSPGEVGVSPVHIVRNSLSELSVRPYVASS